MKEAAGGGITYRYEYTENGLLRRKESSGKTLLQYGYDGNRNLTSLTDVTGKTVRYAYDALNRLERVTDAEQGVELAGYQYTSFGQVRSQEYGNGVRSEYQYGEDGNLTSLVTVTSKGEVLLNYGYAYDGNGNCTKKSGERYQNEYAYDRMNRLTEAAYNGALERYAYDMAGNRLRKETEKEQEFYAYNKKNQLLRLEKGAEVTDYRYDLQGNLLEETGTSGKRYAYDALNRLNRVTIGTVDQKNHYDGESLRYETEENGKVIRFAFDRGELSAEETAGGSIRYIHGTNDVVCSERQGTGYHIRDEAGSTLFILDKEQNIRKAYRYDAFGGVLEERGDIENRLTYTGQIYDGAMGQYYLRARFYNPAIGRFLQEDVYRGDGLNLYAYCSNNPVMYYDPSGYMGLCPSIKTQSGRENDLPKTQYADDFLIQASKDIHAAQYGDAWWGELNPVTVTQAMDGTVIITKNNGVIGPKSRDMARNIFGDDAMIVSGRNTKYDNSKWDFGTLKPNHAEARGIQALLSKGIDVTGARQATTLPSCIDCSRLQLNWGVNNLTGKVRIK